MISSENSIELSLNGVNVSTDQSKVNTTSVIQYTHGELWAEEILKYKELLDRRMITEEEF